MKSSLLPSLLLLVLFSALSLACEQTQPPPTDPLQPAEVVSVIDGYTIEVDIDGVLYKVSYIGLDAPETKPPTKGAEPYGHEASERNRQLVEGETVYLEKDISETDSYGRLLRYVYVGDTMVNAVLVQEGYGQVAAYPPDVRYTGQFLTLQREAREAKRGLWTSGTGSWPSPWPSY